MVWIHNIMFLILEYSNMKLCLMDIWTTVILSFFKAISMIEMLVYNHYTTMHGTFDDAYNMLVCAAKTEADETERT